FRSPPDRRGGRRPERRRRRPQRPLPRGVARRAAREARALRLHPRRARRRRRLRRGALDRLLRARAPLRRQRHGLRHAPDRDRHDGAPPRGRPLVRVLPARRRRRAAPGRLRHLGDGHGRRHGPLRRGRHALPGRRGHLREAGAHRLLRPVRRRPLRDPAPRAGRRAQRPGGRARALRADRARAQGHLGPARHAGHLLPRLHGPCRVPARAGPPHAVLAGGGGVDDPDLAHPVVAPVARDRDGRLRPRPGLRPRRGQAEAGRDAAHGDPPLPPDERALAAARRGRLGPARLRRGLRRAGPRAPLDDGDGAALQQPQDRRLRAGAPGLPGRARGLRDHGLQERHAVQRRPPPPRHDVGLPDGGQRAHPPDERQPPADREGRV
ncbi:MAG: Acyl-CoA dehydrogenase, short-chain specific, partial [uncultured Solirubrobacteraceae bacterium]